MNQSEFGHPKFVEPLVPCNLKVERCPVSRDAAEKRILIQRNAAFGDILMATPLLANLRRAYPTAHITWIAEHTERQAIDANPYVDGVIVWNSRFWKRLVRRLNYPGWLFHALQFRKSLHERGYDVFISLQPEEWPFLARNTGASTRIGVFDTFARFYRKAYTGPNTRIYTHAYTLNDLPDHRVDQYFLALDALGLPKASASRQMTLGYTAEDSDCANAFLQEHRLDESRPFVVLAPLTTWSSKCWPAERFVELGDALEHDGFRVLLTGSAKESENVSAIAARMRVPPITAAGIFTFRQMAAVLDRAALLVSGDTGPLHAAAALQTPYIGLFGPTAAHWYGPQLGPGKLLWRSVPCGPCDQKVCPNTGDLNHLCMRLLTVDEVYAAAKDLIEAPNFTTDQAISEARSS